MMPRLALVVFQCASHWFAVEARQVSAMGQLAALVSESPGLIELSVLLQLERGSKSDAPVAPAGQGFALTLHVQDDTRVLALDAEAQLIELDATSIWPLPALMQHAKRHPSIAALAQHNGHILTLLTTEHLVTE